MLFCLVLVTGSVSATVLHALRIHSTAYRLDLQGDVSEWIGMDVRIGKVLPQSFDRQGFEDVDVALPDTGEQVFRCRSAVWSEISNSAETTRTLTLRDGWLLVGTGAWTGSDYRQMLVGGLGHDYQALGLTQVDLRDIALRFLHPSFEFRAEVTSGLIFFDDNGQGRASLNCARLNGTEVDDPVNISARFTPGSGLTFHEVRLAVPGMPLASLGLDDVLGGNPQAGEFAGTITYGPTDRHGRIEVEGAVRGAHLAELTRKVLGGPFSGLVDIEVDSAVFQNRRLTNLELHGQLSGLRLAEIIPDLGGENDRAELTLQVHQMHWQDNRLTYLSARGQCRNVPLDALSDVVGGGRITGSGRVVIRSLLIVDEELRFADMDLIAEPPPDKPGTMDRELLVKIARKFLDMDLSALLPEEIEYSELGINLVVDRGVLELYGTHGPDSQTILTIKIAGQPFPIISQPERTFDVSSLLGEAKAYVTGLDLETIRRWWRSQHEKEK